MYRPRQARQFEFLIIALCSVIDLQGVLRALLGP
jgi:hypothetical protein